MFKIEKFDKGTFSDELSLCFEYRNGPGRHDSEFIVSSPHWDKPCSFCQQHLEKVIAENPELESAWDEYQASIGIYTYYWGFVCVGINKATGKECGAFIGPKKYKTPVRMGLCDITSESGIRADRDRCGLRYGYSPDEIVYSLKPDEMVPLDRE